MKARVALGDIQRTSGSIPGIVDFSLWAGLRQLSECVYLPAAAGTVGGDAAFGVPEVQAADRVLRQYSGVELDDSGRALPELQDEDFAAVLDD